MAEVFHVSTHIKGLRLAWLEDRVALYLGDLLLFLNDTDSSLQGALSVLNEFLRATGLKVNWSKIQLLAIDPKAKCVAPPALELQWLEKFTYSGMHVSRDAASYYPFEPGCENS